MKKLTWTHTLTAPSEEIARLAFSGALQAHCHSNQERVVKILSCEQSGSYFTMSVQTERVGNIFETVSKLVMKAQFERKAA